METQVQEHNVVVVGIRVQVRIAADVLNKIKETIGKLPAEEGGMLGGDLQTGFITEYYFDESARKTGATYSPNVDVLNQVRRERWKPSKLDMLGFVHSHPPGCDHPSRGDEVYTKDILKATKRERLIMLIAQTQPDCGHYELFAYVAMLHEEEVQIVKADVVVVEPAVVNLQVMRPRKHLAAVKQGHTRRPMPTDVLAAGRVARSIEVAGMTDRVQGAYLLPLMMMSRLIVVGVGGAREWVLNMARAMVMEFILIDPDEVSATNLCTQQCYVREIGKPKVEALADEIRAVQPNARIIARHQPLDDIADDEFERLAFDPMWDVPLPAWGIGVRLAMPPSFVMLAGCTDAFEPQARVNRLGLNFGIPTLCAQVYEQGLCAEITFVDPRTTVACHRCILRSRYEAYLTQGYRNAVTSHGTPIWSTARLNSLKGMVAMAMIHHETGHARWGSLLERIGHRNLIQIRMAPDLSSLGVRSFDKAFSGADQSRLLMDEAIWLPQAPEDGSKGRPRCPECGGTGDLQDALGKFKDTRIMPTCEKR